MFTTSFILYIVLYLFSHILDSLSAPNAPTEDFIANLGNLLFIWQLFGLEAVKFAKVKQLIISRYRLPLLYFIQRTHEGPIYSYGGGNGDVSTCGAIVARRNLLSRHRGYGSHEAYVVG